MSLGPWDDHGTESLVQARTIGANLAVILCAPHGGNSMDGNQAEELQEREAFATVNSGKCSKASFTVVTDIKTTQLLEAIDYRLKGWATDWRCDRDGGLAGAVAARFHRKYIDANRALDDEGAVAVHPGCERAADVHEYYHKAIESAVEVCSGSSVHRREGSRVLLLDVHGQTKFVDNVLIGTGNGTTADLESLNAPGEGFLWHLRRILDGEIQCRRAEEAEHLAGETTIVKPLPGHPEIQGFTGGYTVKRHGLAVEVDAVQLEFGRSFRETTEAREEMAEAVAKAIFYHLQPLVWFLEEADKTRQCAGHHIGDENPTSSTDADDLAGSTLPPTGSVTGVHSCIKRATNVPQEERRRRYSLHGKESDSSAMAQEECQETRRETTDRFQSMGLTTGMKLVKALCPSMAADGRSVVQPGSARSLGLSEEFALACIQAYDQMMADS